MIFPLPSWSRHVPAAGQRWLEAEEQKRASQSALRLWRINEAIFADFPHYLAGSGADAMGTMPGISLHTELELLVRVGLSPREALAAATNNYSLQFGWNELGQIAPGRRADILAVDADPTANIWNARRISLIVLNGEPHRSRFTASPQKISRSSPAVTCERKTQFRSVHRYVRSRHQILQMRLQREALIHRIFPLMGYGQPLCTRWNGFFQPPGQGNTLHVQLHQLRSCNFNSPFTQNGLHSGPLSIFRSFSWMPILRCDSYHDNPDFFQTKVSNSRLLWPNPVRSLACLGSCPLAFRLARHSPVPGVCSHSPDR